MRANKVPLRAMIAWVVTKDEDFVGCVAGYRVRFEGLEGNPLDDPYVLARCLVRAMKEEYCFVDGPIAAEFPGEPPYIPGREASVEEYIGNRIQRAAEEICERIGREELPAEGVLIQGDTPSVAGPIPSSAMTETMRLGRDGWLHQERNGGPAWKSVAAPWQDFLRCFPPSTPTKHTVKSKFHCTKWLEELMKSSPQKRTSSFAELQQRALTMFPGLSKRAFRGAWGSAVDLTGADRWREGGRPRKETARSAPLPGTRAGGPGPKTLQQKPSHH